ncbi:hypothetical protein ACFLRY_01770, partial [Bacteroidota bacterium]
FTSNAQKVKVLKGDLKFLKGQTEILVKFDYDNMGVGKFKNEDDYVNKKVSDYNAKEPGNGDRWKEAWIADRNEHYEPKFEQLFNKVLQDIGLRAGANYSNAKYTLIIKTYFIEPGYNIGISKKNASMSSEAIFVETANPDNVVCKIDLPNAPGRGGNDYDSGVRVGEAYAKCGKTLAAYIVKKLK